jgi:hypothetical protein
MYRQYKCWKFVPKGTRTMTNSGVYFMMDMALVLKVRDEWKWSGNLVVVDSIFFQQRESKVVML